MRISIGILLTITLATLFGCGSETTENATNCDYDRITITRLEPTTTLEGISTDFSLDVSYCLASTSSGQIHIAFNDGTSPNTYSIKRYTGPLTKGRGDESYLIPVVPKNWGTAGIFSSGAFLAIYPLTQFDRPLDYDYRTIVVTAPSTPASPPGPSPHNPTKTESRYHLQPGGQWHYAPGEEPPADGR